MTPPGEQFPYVTRDPALGNASLAPMLPLTLIGSQSVPTSGLLDSGAAINVLPYTLGVQLGFDWDQQINSVELSGNLASVAARYRLVSRGPEFFTGAPRVRLGESRYHFGDPGSGQFLYGVRCLFLSLPVYV
jgi:hypothetical protein